MEPHPRQAVPRFLHPAPEPQTMLIDRSFAELFAQTPHTRPERRAQPRIPIHTEVMVAAEERFFSALSADVSQEGIFLLTHRVLPLGTSVSLEFSLPKGQVVARGTVRWVRAAGEGKLPGLGVVFDQLDGKDRALVRAFCSGRPRFLSYEEVRAETESDETGHKH